MPATASRPVDTEDLLRAQVYALLAASLLAPPDAALMRSLAALSGDDSDLGQGFSALSRAAAETPPAAAAEEYQTLFIGVGRGELVPYGSYYLTGFLHEKPLAALRTTMAGLGIARADGMTDPEDHIGSLCEIMSGLITGQYGAPAPLTTQGAMFRDHIAPWAGHFFADLEATETARFYRPLGRIGALFMDIERQAFEMD